MVELMTLTLTSHKMLKCCRNNTERHCQFQYRMENTPGESPTTSAHTDSPIEIRQQHRQSSQNQHKEAPTNDTWAHSALGTTAVPTSTVSAGGVNNQSRRPFCGRACGDPFTPPPPPPPPSPPLICIIFIIDYII